MDTGRETGSELGQRYAPSGVDARRNFERLSPHTNVQAWKVRLLFMLGHRWGAGVQIPDRKT